MSINKICVVGLGYIGLPTAAVLASRGLEVVGLEVDANIVETINAGHIHIVEPDLGMVVNAAVTTGNLRASLIPEEADVFIIAVPTPLDNNRRPDISFIESAAHHIAPVLKKNDLVLLESTSPVGTTQTLCKWFAKNRPDLKFPHQSTQEPDIHIAHCPERVLPGKVLAELVHNDRIIGGITPDCAQAACDFYRIFVRGKCMLTNAPTAELAKLTENAYRDTNIAFANELSLICNELDINVWELIGLANHHPRVNILQPGPGVGGHCIAVDPWFIVHSAPQHSELIQAARRVNDGKPEHVVKQVLNAASRFKAPTIACLGLSFKADIDDLRGSPAIHIVKRLTENSQHPILVVEPHIQELPEDLEGRAEICSLESAVKRSDIIVLLVDHEQFRGADRQVLNQKVVIDTRGVFSASNMNHDA